MDFMTQMDIRVFIHENYIELLVLCGLLILTYEYRGIHIPATRTKGQILLVLFLMTVSNSLEKWGAASPDTVQRNAFSSQQQRRYHDHHPTPKAGNSR